MKVIFLDIDGVLNTAEGWFHYDRLGEPKTDKDFENQARFDPRACANLAYVFTKMPDAKIVIHSSWRRIMALDTLKRMLAAYGACTVDQVAGATDRKMSKEEGINEYVKANAVTHYAVVEDHEMSVPAENLIQVNHSYTGFTILDAFRTLDALGYVERHPLFLF